MEFHSSLAGQFARHGRLERTLWDYDGRLDIGEEPYPLDRRNITRISLEGALNGIGFVIGTAIVGLALSLLLILAHRVIALAVLPFSGIVL